MQHLLSFVLLLICLSAWGQRDIEVSNVFTVEGLIKEELSYTVADILRLEAAEIPDVVLTNHSGEPRGTAKELSGILVKELLKDLELSEDSPKLFSEFYLTFIAMDNYKVVYSWNEIFNSPIGDQLFVITSRDGKNMQEMEDRILVLTPADFKTGRRHIKALHKIVVNRVD